MAPVRSTCSVGKGFCRSNSVPERRLKRKTNFEIGQHDVATDDDACAAFEVRNALAGRQDEVSGGLSRVHGHAKGDGRWQQKRSRTAVECAGCRRQTSVAVSGRSVLQAGGAAHRLDSRPAYLMATHSNGISPSLSSMKRSTYRHLAAALGCSLPSGCAPASSLTPNGNPLSASSKSTRPATGSHPDRRSWPQLEGKDAAKRCGKMLIVELPSELGDGNIPLEWVASSGGRESLR